MGSGKEGVKRKQGWGGGVWVKKDRVGKEGRERARDMQSEGEQERVEKRERERKVLCCGLSSCSPPEAGSWQGERRRSQLV